MNIEENTATSGQTLLAQELRSIADSTSYQLVRNQILEVLRKNIILGVLADGERIIEEQIAQMAGVSRVPVREAIRMLEAEGFVVTLPRRGTRVIGFSEEDIYEIFRIRGMIEELACEYIVECASDEVIAEGRRLLDETAHAIEMAEAYHASWDSSFSQLFNQWIGRASGRRRLNALHEQYNGYITTFRMINSSNLERRKKALEEHRLIWNALAARDKQAAQQAVRAHANSSLEALLQRRSTSFPK